MQVKCPNCGATDDVDISHIPPGKALLRCRSCFTSFEIFIKPEDVPLADCREEGEYLVVVCPYCGSVFNSSADIYEQSLFWSCPNCESIFRLPEREVVEQKEQTAGQTPAPAPESAGAEEPTQSEETLEIGDISPEVIEQLERELSAKSEEPGSESLGEQAGEDVPLMSETEDMAPPLTEKEKFSAQFIVKIGGGEIGPISYNVLEDWARAEMIPRNALVAKVGENKFYRADHIPELLAIFEGKEKPVGGAIKEILKEESSGEKILHGITAGLLGGLVGGVIASPVVLLGLWNPAPAFNSVLSALVFIIGSVVIGAGIGAINSVISLWLIDYPWILPVQLGISAIFGLAIAIFNFAVNGFLRDSLISGALVFVFALIIAYSTMRFHHKFYEKV